jgi:hypothetical protein
MPTMLLRQQAADYLKIHFAKLERLRRAGLIPEAVRAGHLYVFPADKLDTIKARLIEQGHITAPNTEAANVA